MSNDKQKQDTSIGQEKPKMTNLNEDSNSHEHNQEEFDKLKRQQESRR